MDGMEQVVSRQKAQLIPSAKARKLLSALPGSMRPVSRLRKLMSGSQRAALTLTQQIAADGAKLQALQNEAAQLSAELEARRVEAMRPQLESQLQRIEAFLGRSGQSQAEQAREQVLTQGAAMQADWSS